MTKKELKGFVSKHKKGICIAGSAVACILGACVYSKLKSPKGTWNFTIPYNETDKIALAKKWNSTDKYNGKSVIGLRNVTLNELCEQAKIAYESLGMNEDAVLGQVLLTDIKQER